MRSVDVRRRLGRAGVSGFVEIGGRLAVVCDRIRNAGALFCVYGEREFRVLRTAMCSFSVKVRSGDV